MSDRSGRRQVGAERASGSRYSTDVRRGGGFARPDEVSTQAISVSFYGRLHGLTPTGYRTAAFGGTGLLGGAVLLLGHFARTGGSLGPLGGSVRTLAIGLFLLAFGGGYFVVRARSSCSSCETAFARRRTRARQIRRESDGQGPDEVYLEETFECEACGDRTTEPSSYAQFSYLQF
ncbi:hypothetical protein NGM10_01210 [Halorussus salilacus]|uniref:hypothetical protein n=1 Tax=Halorussus salilacus TaxID=2953750 RepID=UPI0020A20166|nr:hypothetical protein [Halorussus salilacus]USZ68373.1 hypothetical protein NGM10_01210 [Halorussus salilacus]